MTFLDKLQQYFDNPSKINLNNFFKDTMKHAKDLLARLEVSVKVGERLNVSQSDFITKSKKSIIENDPTLFETLSHKQKELALQYTIEALKGYFKSMLKFSCLTFFKFENKKTVTKLRPMSVLFPLYISS